VEVFILPKADLESFVGKLIEQYEVFGPSGSWNGPEFRFAPINSATEMQLDYGTTILPPHKKVLHPPQDKLMKFQGRAEVIKSEAEPKRKQLLFGIHACDVNAMLTLDQVFLSTYPDPAYKLRRENLVIIGLNCTEPKQNCFCSSFNAGPAMDTGYDLALTDIGDRYVVEVGTATGKALTAGMTPAADSELIARNRSLRAAQEKIAKHIDTHNLGEFLQQNLEHSKWNTEAERCLTCGACTNVCPTCFCFYLKDTTDLTLVQGERSRFWASCMSLQFSRVATDHVFRRERKGRLQHRLMHKLVNEELQFGALGCVGCGRCLTYCPAYIDIVDIVQTIKKQPLPAKAVTLHKPKAQRICPDKDPWEPQPAVIEEIKQQTRDTNTYRFRFTDPALREQYSFEPGVFNMVSLFGIGEAPISISSSPDLDGVFEHTIRGVGNVSHSLAKLQVGDSVGIRGPYGTGWPMAELKGKNVLIVAGGIGLAPLRSVIKSIQARREDYGHLEILYGARTPGDMLYTDEFAEWRQIPNSNLLMCVDACPADIVWGEDIGVVTALFNKMQSKLEDTKILVCGPDIMMKFVVADLIGRGFAPEQIFISLERRMNCGIKKCGNCQIGSVFVCQDGPVFRYADVQNLSESVF